MGPTSFGFVGLGDMGNPMSGNLAKAGFTVTVYDRAGTEALAPGGVICRGSVADVARAADSIFLSLPDGGESMDVARRIVATEAPRTTCVIDLSTTGPVAARDVAAVLEPAGIAYSDAPVSGGRKGAIAATIALMFAGPGDRLQAHLPALQAFTGKVFHIGTAVGLGQTVKLANNFLSAMAMAATSEAVAFGLAHGVELGVMLDVFNASTGRNAATLDKFPERIATGSYDAGFKTQLMAKDVALYLQTAAAAHTPRPLGPSLESLWRAANAAMPGSDFTRIFDFVRQGPKR